MIEKKKDKKVYFFIPFSSCAVNPAQKMLLPRFSHYIEK